MAYQANLRLSRGPPGPAEGVAVVGAGQGNNLYIFFCACRFGDLIFRSMMNVSDDLGQNVVMPAGAAAAATADSPFNFTVIVWLSTYL